MVFVITFFHAPHIAPKILFIIAVQCFSNSIASSICTCCRMKKKAAIVPQYLPKLGKIDHELLLCPLSI